MFVQQRPGMRRLLEIVRRGLPAALGSQPKPVEYLTLRCKAVDHPALASHSGWVRPAHHLASFAGQKTAGYQPTPRAMVTRAMVQRHFDDSRPFATLQQPAGRVYDKCCGVVIRVSAL